MSIFGNNPNYGGAPGNCAPGTPRVEGGGNFIWNNEQGSAELQAFISNTIITGDVTQVNRIVKYQLFWNFYDGLHWRQYNDTFLHFNYCRVVVDKINAFLKGDTAFSTTVEADDGEEVPEEIERYGESYVESVWKKNDKVGTVSAMLQMGGICGDVWTLVQWDSENEKISLVVLDSRQCFPEFENGDVTRLTGFTVRQPLQRNEKQYLLKCTRYTRDFIETWYQRTTAVGDNVAKIEYVPYNNPYGFIPIVHTQNIKDSKGYFGYSDLQDILSLNKTYNEEMQSMKEIVDYYTSPVTVITGGTLKVATRGVGNVWSGLPAEANVFNLTLGEDMQGMQTFTDKVKTGIHEISDVPEAVLGKLQNVSNTSAAALQIMYQPLLQRAKDKSTTYTEGVKRLNKMILKIGAMFEPNKRALKALLNADSAPWENYEFIPVWKYGLPQDVMQDLQQGQIELASGLTSKKQLMNKLGKKNVPQLQKEINQEKIDDAKVQRQAQDILTPEIQQGQPGQPQPGGKPPKNGSQGNNT